LRQIHRYIPVLVLALTIGITSCDETSGPAGTLEERPSITDFQVTPSSIRFSEEDGFKDTLVTFRVTAVSNMPEDFQLVTELADVRDRQILTNSTMAADPEGSGRYTASLSLAMSTSRFDNLVIYAYPRGPDGTVFDRVESTIKIRGIDTGRPEVLEIIHPDSIFIPQPGEPDNLFTISTRVTHTFALENINRVQLDLFDSANTRIFTSNMSRSDPDGNGDPEYLLYGQDFSINSGNSPDSYRIEVHATDIAGTVSDTLSSTLIITR